jgi:hypothetical protein
MATYNRGDKFIPINIADNNEAYLGYAQKRMDLMAQGEAMLKSQYKNILDLELSHTESKQKLDTYLQGATNELNKYVSKDLSNLDNVKSALKVFDPLTTPEYKDVLKDNQFTKHYKTQLEVANGFKNQVDKKGNIGTAFAEPNYRELQVNMSKFLANKDANQWGDLYEYKPFYDKQDETLELTDKFMKLPDDHEEQKLDPSTGLITSIKYKGKSQEQIARFLQNNYSAKAKDQMLLEGRVVAYGIDDNEYVNTLKEQGANNIKNINKQLTNLEILGKKDDIKLTKEQLGVYKNDLKAQLLKEQNDLKDLNDPFKLPGIKSQKVENYSRYHANALINSTAGSLANERVDQTFETNQAYVSLLNRQADMDKYIQTYRQNESHFNRKLAYEQEKDAANLLFNYLKEGLDPKTGKPVSLGPDGNGVVVPDVTSQNEDDYIKEIEKTNADKDLWVASLMEKVVPSAMIAMGISNAPTTATRRYEDLSKTLAYVKNIGDKYQANDPDLLRLDKADPKTLTPVEKAKQTIIHTLKADEAYATFYNEFENKKKEIGKKYKASASSLEEIPWFTRVKDKTKTDMLSGATGLPLVGDVLYNGVVSLFDSKSAMEAKLKAMEAKELKEVIGLVNMKQVISRPLSINTASEKQSNEAFNNQISSIRAAHPELLNGIDLAAITDIERVEGGYRLLQNSRSRKDKEDLTIEVKGGDPIFIKDASVKVANQIDKIKIAALAMSKNGSYGYMAKNESGSITIPFKIGTANGTPYNANLGENLGMSDLVAQIKIGDEFVTLPGSYQTPTLAEEQVKEFTRNLSSNIEQSLLKNKVGQIYKMIADNKIPDSESVTFMETSLKKYADSGEYDREIQKEKEKLFSSGDIYNMLGAKNPNLSSTQQIIDNVLKSLKR